ncbi:MAG: hypothetical protein NXI07_05700 [bacterium]|nr:hypothetical protein [bacterium]
MQEAEPTTLHVPASTSPAAAETGLIGFAWVAVLIPVVVLVAWYVLRARRLAQLNPEEHAFRSLARRFRLRANQIERVRRYAHEIANCSPLEVLMDDDLRVRVITSAD